MSDKELQGKEEEKNEVSPSNTAEEISEKEEPVTETAAQQIEESSQSEDETTKPDVEAVSDTSDPELEDVPVGEEAQSESEATKPEVEPVSDASGTEALDVSVAEETQSEDKATKPDAESVNTTVDEETHDDDEEEVASSDDEEVDETEEDVQKDYSTLSKSELITELQSLIKDKPIQEIKNEVEEIRTEFNSKFTEELEHKKEEFLAAGGNIIDFHYTTPLKKEFNSLLFDYKEKRGNHYKNLKKDLQANLSRRLELVDELKGLLNAEENINTTYKHFKDIQERWHVAGAIPRDKYNIVWNTYHHHVENFYDFLHLNREFRDLDFKHNLEQKLKLIGRAEELGQEVNINKAFRELQMLHKMWKEDIGPVAKEYREEVWDKFSLATKVIHDKRQGHLKDQEKHFEANYDSKMELVKEIIAISQNAKATHQSWQTGIKKVQELREKYFEIGQVPRTLNKDIWNSFKEATRTFNKEKNNFYKNQKKEQYLNLEKKRELIKIAIENKDSDDFEATTALMKKIQSDWKKIGHVPRKESDKIWKEFKEGCNHYFDRLHAQKNVANKEEVAHLDAKQAILDSLSSFEPSDTPENDIATLKGKISEWKEIGRVPYNKRNIDRKFNKVLDDLFSKLNLSKQETELIKFENKINSMVSQEDERKLQNERFFISKKIGETKDEIRQLENNLGFFQNVNTDNPLIKEVHKNIARHKEQLEVWKAKLSKIKSLQ